MLYKNLLSHCGWSPYEKLVLKIFDFEAANCPSSLCIDLCSFDPPLRALYSL